METQQAAHPAPRTLAAFALNRLSAEARERLQTHLRSCAACTDFLARTPQYELQALLGSVERSRAEQSTPGERNRETIRSPDPPVRAQASAGVRPPSPAMPAAATEAIPAALREQSKYRVVQLLGRGGMGSVYEARHERMDRRVAIKVINPELVGNPQAIERFNAEVQAVSKLDHANIARAYDAETFGSLQAIIMEFVEGQSLYDFMKAHQRAGGQLSVTDACRLIRQTLLGLQHAHERGIAHRDLKPQNLMLTRDKGIVKILDFGLAKLTSDRRGLTKTNVTMGTYEYMAPEQALDAATAGPRADIYSLGCTLYYLLAGVLPFAHDTDVKLLLAHQSEIPRPLIEVRPDVPQAVSDLVARMLAKNPADRPQTAAEIAQTLLPFAKGEVPAPAAKGAAAAPGVAGPLDFINAPGQAVISGVWEPEPLPLGNRGASYKASASGYSSRKTNKSQAPAIFGMVAVVSVLTIGLIAFAMSRGGDVNQENPTSVAMKVERHSGGEPPITKPLKTSPPKNSTPPDNTGDRPSSKPTKPAVSPVVETTHPSTNPNPTADMPVQPNPTDNPPPAPVQLPPVPVEMRKRVPDQAAQTKALATVHEVLKDDYANALTPEARINLINKLIKLASETNDDANLRYVMGTQAVDLAVKAGETDLAFAAIDGMNAYFAVDGWALKAESLQRLSHQAKSLPSRKEVAALALTMSDSAFSAERYDAAVELASIAITMSDLVGDPLLRDHAHEAHARALRVQNLAQEYEAAKEKLAALPDDAEANLSVGRFLCFQKNDWKAGVRFLARGNDETLKTLADMESKLPTDAAEQMKLADAWWTAAEKTADKSGTVGKPMFARAKYWYREALPGLSGFALEKAQKRASDESGAEIGNAKLIFLDDLPEQDVSVGVGSFGKHGSTGLPIDQPQEVVFHGVPTKHALFMQPPDDGISKASFMIDRKFHNFVSIVGLLDGSSPNRPATFDVRGDGKLLWRSRPIHNSSESQECNVSVSNFKVLQLIVHCSGKSDGCRAIWVNPLLKK